jgi:hypothetical protein
VYGRDDDDMVLLGKSWRPTHSELVARVLRWLKVTKKFPVVLGEIGTDGYECPDVIGWTSWPGESWVIECKISRSDFLADRKKPFRLHPEKAFGSFRVFATPPGLIKVDELPPKFGLIEVRQKSVKVLRKPQRHEMPVWVHMREKRLLMSAVRRATEGWGLHVFGDPKDLKPSKRVLRGPTSGTLPFAPSEVDGLGKLPDE